MPYDCETDCKSNNNCNNNINIIKNVVVDENEIIHDCNHCNKSFSTNSSLVRHYKNCIVKKEESKINKLTEKFEWKLIDQKQHYESLITEQKYKHNLIVLELTTNNEISVVKINSLEEKINSLEEKIKLMSEHKDEIKIVTRNAGNMVGTAIHAMNYVIDTYKTTSSILMYTHETHQIVDSDET